MRRDRQVAYRGKDKKEKDNDKPPIEGNTCQNETSEVLR